MFSEKLNPESISMLELDEFLAKAWYRMGQSIFTCHFIFFEEGLFSPIWMRLPLEGYTFSKSLRKIMAKCRAEFRTEIRAASITAEKEALFQRYRKKFKGRLSPTLTDSLQDGKPHNIYPTLEIAVYKGKKLIAFSFFDLGCTSIASIKGVYDPRFADYSLGLYTMLEEIKFGLDSGRKYFYPGYIVPGYFRFDYKLRVAKPALQEFYELKSGTWKTYDQFDLNEIPLKVISSKLMDAVRSFSASGIVCKPLYYPGHDADIFGFDIRGCLDSPLFLHVFCDSFSLPRFVVYFDLNSEHYFFNHCLPLSDYCSSMDFNNYYNNPEDKLFIDFLLMKSRILVTKDLKELTNMVFEFGKLIQSSKVRFFV